MADLAATVAANPGWYHTIELAPGVVTPGHVDLRGLPGAVLPRSLTGRRALDVGTFSGTYSSVFIASPVLTHWKERESVYHRRRLRIAAANGGVVPAYADGAAAVEAPVVERKRGPVRLSDDPAQGVSQKEFDQMVRDLHVEAPPVATSDPAADATPEELVMKDDPSAKREKRRGPRNRKHGRR